VSANTIYSCISASL